MQHCTTETKRRSNTNLDQSQVEEEWEQDEEIPYQEKDEEQGVQRKEKLKAVSPLDESQVDCGTT